MPKPLNLSQEQVEMLADKLYSFEKRPLDFVYWAFPFGQKGTPLENIHPDTIGGLEKWQYQVFKYIQDRLQSGEDAPIRVGIASGHGIGKSAFAAMFNIWALTTKSKTKCVITANTKNQLETKTWVETSKWFNLFIARELFNVGATSMTAKDTKVVKEWRTDIIPWSKENTDAFAGLHNQGQRLAITFDESSEIIEKIWETCTGAETDKDTQIIRLSFGNPTTPDSYFREIFPGGKFAAAWWTINVSSYEVSLTNKKVLDEIVALYGEDSDVARVRVFGKFPKQAGDAFITRLLVEEAISRPLPNYNSHPVVLGVDLARKGDDATVIYPRQGADARSRPVLIYPKVTVPQAIHYVKEAVYRFRPDQVFIDAGYIGYGVLDALWLAQTNNPQLATTQFIAVDFGSRPEGGSEQAAEGRYAKKRDEIWGRMRAWLERGCIPNEVAGYPRTLLEELIEPVMKPIGEDVVIKLIPKKQMRFSPNIADALACTFAMQSVLADETPSEYYAPLLPNKENYSPYAESNIYGTG